MTIQVEGELDAHDLEAVIHELAAARAGLEPPVPLDPPGLATPGDALVQSETRYAIATLADGGLRVWLRNTGAGLMAFDLDAAAREDLGRFLGQKPGHTFTSH